jgi:hypothetical protein
MQTSVKLPSVKQEQQNFVQMDACIHLLRKIEAEPSIGSYVLLESNDIPGFSGFSVTVREAVALRLRAKLEGNA